MVPHLRKTDELAVKGDLGMFLYEVMIKVETNEIVKDIKLFPSILSHFYWISISVVSV